MQNKTLTTCKFKLVAMASMMCLLCTLLVASVAFAKLDEKVVSQEFNWELSIMSACSFEEPLEYFSIVRLTNPQGSVPMNEKAIVALATYDKDNQLIDCKIKELKLDRDRSISFEIEEEIFGKSFTQKAFLWEGFDTMRPLAQSAYLDLGNVLSYEQMYIDFLIYLQSIGQDDGSTLDDIAIRNYYGTVNNCMIVYLVTRLNDFPFPPVNYRHEVAGYEIWLPPFPHDVVYVERTFMSIEKAYEEGYFSKDDVYEAACLLDASFKERYANPLF